MTSLAVRAFVGVESQKESRDAIEQRENRSERTKQSAPGSSDKEDGDKEQNENRQLYNARPNYCFAGHRLAYHRRHRRFQCSGRTYPADKKRVLFAEEVGHSHHRSDQYDVAKVTGDFGQVEFRRRDFGRQVLQEAERADPAAYQRAEQSAERNEQSDGDKRKNMKRAELSDYADRAGER
ncbi:hypothetical protein ES705_40817 [subsurface metagenome]